MSNKEKFFYLVSRIPGITIWHGRGIIGKHPRSLTWIHGRWRIGGNTWAILGRSWRIWFVRYSQV